MATTSKSKIKSNMTTVLALAALFTLIITSSTSASQAESRAVNSYVMVEGLWLRESVPGAQNGAAFGSIRNTSEEILMLIGAESNVAESVEVHQHIHRNGQMAMEEIEALTIPAGETVTLQPGGYHIMLMHLKAPLEVGDSFPLTLHFSTGESVTLEAPVHPLVR